MALFWDYAGWSAQNTPQRGHRQGGLQITPGLSRMPLQPVHAILSWYTANVVLF